jgi:D-xylose transport system substrate-binding protein
MRRTSLALLSAAACLALTVTACGDDGSDGTGGTPGAQGTPKVGVILPDTKSSARWEAFDRPLLEKAMRDAGIEPIIDNAENDTGKFSTIADSMIQRGVSVMLITNLSDEQGAAIERKARENGIPVVDYDRLSLGGSADYYVSFDNVEVGRLQGQGLVDCLQGKQNPQIIQINGAPTDNNATLFKQGAIEVLQPKYDSGEFVLRGDQAIEKWDNQIGGNTFQQLLTANGGRVDGVLAANDGLAGAVITVLRSAGLAGQVPVTGQDATPDGLANILRGYQCMTVYKPVPEEAEAAAQLAIALAKGDKAAADALAKDTVKDPRGNRDVKSVLRTPQAITKENIKKVFDDGFVAYADVCKGDVVPLCQQAGITG